MNPAERLLGRLDGVRRTGPGRWITRCPAHEDRRPSLSVRECADGRLLLHCFSCRDADAVVAAVGLTLADLFPPSDAWTPATSTSSARTTGRRAPRIPASDALLLVDAEALFLEIVAHRLAEGELLSDDTRRELETAASRVALVRRGWLEATA